MADDWLTPAQVHDQYGINPQTLANWRWRKVGPEYTKLGDGPGGRVRYRRGAVERFLDKRTVQTGDAA